LLVNVIVLYVIVLNVIFGICYYVTLLSVSTVYCLLRRCCWPSPKNFAALKQFGVCDNKLFDLDFLTHTTFSCVWMRSQVEERYEKKWPIACWSWLSLVGHPRLMTVVRVCS